MKWIGQHIWDLISRFRGDVYLEDISTGTIASGSNLGLDSNNKIVKATLSSGGISHDGSTANGVLTFKDADEATVESNLTFDGNNLSIPSGNIELGHATDTTIARSAAGVATIEGKIAQTRDKVIYMETSNFSDDINTDAHYIPFITTSEHTNFANVAVPMLAPVAGKLLGVHFKANVDTNTSSNTVQTVSASSSAGSIVGEVSQTNIPAGTILYFSGSTRIITLNGNITINKMPSSNRAIYLNLDNFITPGVSGD